MLVLSGDIGGTKSRLQLTRFETATQFEVVAQTLYFNKKFDHFALIVKQFLEEHGVAAGSVEGVCFAVAGPIVGGRVKFTNLPWSICEKEIAEELGFAHVKLMNDFEAIGYGIETLKKANLYVLQEGKVRKNKNRTMIGAGTGLGVAIAVHTAEGYQVLPTEGGHVDFAPTDEMQLKLLEFMLKKRHRVSIERLVSGQGLENIYYFVVNNPIFSEKENPDLKLALFRHEDPAAKISEFAITHHDPMAMRALDLFIRIYGTCAGNLALTTLPYGGLYVVGGIAPKLLKQLIDGRFLTAYSDKGRMSDLLKSLPVYIVLDTQVGLQGAANYAYKMER